MSHVILFIFRVYASSVILDGQLFVIKEEKHIVVPLIMHLHKFYKGFNMIIQLIFGA
jgi:hypothetical protein